MSRPKKGAKVRVKFPPYSEDWSDGKVYEALSSQFVAIHKDNGTDRYTFHFYKDEGDTWAPIIKEEQ